VHSSVGLFPANDRPPPVSNPVVKLFHCIPGLAQWKIGTQLRTMLQQPDGSLPGFMTVNDVVLRKSESGVDPRKGRMRFAGMVRTGVCWCTPNRVMAPAASACEACCWGLQFRGPWGSC